MNVTHLSWFEMKSFFFEWICHEKNDKKAFSRSPLE